MLKTRISCINNAQILSFGKFEGLATGVEGVKHFMWEVMVGIGPSSATFVMVTFCSNNLKIMRGL